MVCCCRSMADADYDYLIKFLALGKLQNAIVLELTVSLSVLCTDQRCSFQLSHTSVHALFMNVETSWIYLKCSVSEV